MENTVLESPITPQTTPSPISENPLQKSNSKMIVIAVLVIALLFAMGIGGYYLGTQSSQEVQVIETTPTPSIKTEPSPIAVACTLEAKLCPDGSSVGRSGPNCEFEACPEVKNWQSYTNTEYGFSFEHPKDWQVRDLQPGNPQDFPKRKFWIGYAPNTIQEDVLGMIEITSYTLEEKIAEFKRTNTSSVSLVLAEEKKVTFANTQATELTVRNTYTNKDYSYLFFTHKGNTFQVSRNSADDAIVLQISETFSLTQ